MIHSTLCFIFYSRPTPLTASGKKGGRCRDTKFPNVPKCKCGSIRTFEFQLMPSILHLLEVDLYYQKKNLNLNDNIKDNNKDLLEYELDKNEGGMNWGVIAIYSCPNSCDESCEEFVVVQESVDSNPQKMVLSAPPMGSTNNDDSDEDTTSSNNK